MSRRDSVRNRERLVTSAREVFAEHGFGATLDDIARHAGLGTGTAYRHFPNKHAIAAEVLRDATEQIVVDAEEALAIEDPWDGLVQFFQRTASRQATDRGLYETLTGQGDDDEQARIWPRIVASVTELFERGQRAGAIREDAAPQDVAAVFAMLGPAFAMSRTIDPELWRRYLALMLDALRPGHPPLPVPPPPAAALDTILRSSKK
ncbi:TetR/AcrR family transcriptional regulator [Kribbella kalugense]|uniref:TetR family transcriptional regulator n=1 Tax=Kribbella kalugense TaxID=2512221 RepID=A0A4R8A3E0_9ACTN|nr:TetR/AcrR family transcriptional regulator [Kribbella kalugense]TDW23938.1 TetR family transcriptional regulator [Kribbella kalugense]